MDDFANNLQPSMPVVFSSTERSTVLNSKLTPADLAGQAACVRTR